MQAYIVTSSEFHDNPICFGVFSTLENAKAAVLKCSFAAKIEIVEIDAIYLDHTNTHIAPTMEGVEVVERKTDRGAFVLG